ncbi:MAG: class I SAM-dependent methyltransferase [bacterium]|nr:class I SAM-dependent methyltransferase [bacterium]
MTVCPICDGESRSVQWSKDGFDYARCDGCGLVSLEPLPTEPDSGSLYSEGYFREGASGGYVDYAGDEATHRRNARDRCRLLPSSAGALLDVGCAVGFFLDEARRAGWRVTGVEVSPWAAEQARERTGADVHASLDAVLEATDEPVDAVTFFQVLEHLPHPARTLARARDLLKPGGRVVIETWDRDSLVARLFGSHWQQVTPPSVIHLFARRDVDALLERAGFRPVSTRRTTKRVSVGFVAGLLAGKYPRAGGWFRALVTRSRLDGLAVPYRLGDLITVVAERGT